MGEKIILKNTLIHLFQLENKQKYAYYFKSNLITITFKEGYKLYYLSIKFKQVSTRSLNAYF